MHVRPLRRPQPTRGNQPQTHHPGQQPQYRQASFLAPDHRPPLAGVKLVRPRRRPAGRPGLRALQLDPDRAPARTRQLRAKPQQQAPPTPTAGGHRARPARPLDSRDPHGCGYGTGVGDSAVMAAAGVHGFPAVLTSFVGRAVAVDEVAGLLGEGRLVTVTGPGGVGKTRLAGEVARRVAGRFADGVWLMELARCGIRPRSPRRSRRGWGCASSRGWRGRGGGAGAGPAAAAAGAG